jgi:hypothetical protein
MLPARWGSRPGALKGPGRPGLLLSLCLSCGQLAACSFIGSYGPPPDYQRVQSFDCTGYTLPVLDTIWAGLNGFGAISAAASTDDEWNSRTSIASRSTTIAVGLVWLALSGASAAYGYSTARECTKAKDDVADRPKVPPSSLR